MTVTGTRTTLLPSVAPLLSSTVTVARSVSFIYTDNMATFKQK
jgi:hypothetical protein